MMTASVILLLFAAGCVSPYAGRDGHIIMGRYGKVRNEARKDLEALGQFSVRGRITGTVFSSRSSYDTRYVHYAELAHGIIPLAYYDMARASLAMHRYTDAVRCAKNAIVQGSHYYKEDKWTMPRLLNLMNNHKILYEGYLYLGDIESAAISHKQFLVLSQIANSKAFKDVTANALTLRLTSMRMRSDYLAGQHWSNLQMVLILAATVAQAQQQQQDGDYGSAAQTIADGLLLAGMIAELKQQLQIEHGVNLAVLMDRAETINRLPAPSDEDIERAKMASRLYSLASARDVSTAVSTVSFRDLKDTMKEVTGGITISYEDGKVRVRGNLAALIAASMKIDQIPLKLPSPPAEGADDYLDKYLTADLYRMAGLKITDEEAGYFRKILEEGGEEYTFDLTDEKSRTIINGIRRMMQKANEFDRWAAAI